MRLVAIVFLFGCGRAAPVATKPQSRPIKVQAPLVEVPVGAVPIPGEYVRPEQPLNQLDTTVRIADLPKPDAAWGERVSIAYRGRVAIALHIAGHDHLELTIVDTVTETPSGYPGGLQDFRLGTANTHDQPSTGNAFSARDVDPKTSQFVGPVMFAVRILPKEGAPEAERRHYAVYLKGRTVFVAEKLVTDTRWIPRMRLEAPNATEIVAIDPGWH